MRSVILTPSRRTPGLSGSAAAGPGSSGVAGFQCVAVSFSEKYSSAMMWNGSPLGVAVGMTLRAEISSSVMSPRMACARSSTLAPP